MAAPLLETVGPIAASKGKELGRDVGRARIPTGNRQYQGVILAEFVTAALIVALAPIARGKAAQDATPGPSPYGPDDIKQLAGIGAVYFVLALLSSGKYGRLSAWFGGLVLIGIGLAETTSGGLAGIFGIFQPSGKSAGSSDAGGGAAVGGAIAQGVGAAEAGLGVQPVPDATGIFPTIPPGGSLGFVSPGVSAAIAQQAENQFARGQTATIVQDNSTGNVSLA